MKLNWFSFKTKKRILAPFAFRKEPSSSRRRESSPLQEIHESINAEKIRLSSIKKQLDNADYDAALRSLLSDTNADLHYFNAVKNEADPRSHNLAFLERHGKLIDFTHEPNVKNPPKDCVWIGLHGYRNKTYRCHNKSIVCDGKELNFCAYHAKFCINTSNHPVPAKISHANEAALCNECFVLQYGHAPKVLSRIPGTRKKT